MSSGAREAVARAIAEGDGAIAWEYAYEQADAALAALRPIIIDGLRTWAGAKLFDPEVGGQSESRHRALGRVAQLEELVDSAEGIASRICGGDQ
jgi:hypothetical protein